MPKKEKTSRRLPTRQGRQKTPSDASSAGLERPFDHSGEHKDSRLAYGRALQAIVRQCLMVSPDSKDGDQSFFIELYKDFLKDRGISTEGIQNTPKVYRGEEWVPSPESINSHRQIRPFLDELWQLRGSEDPSLSLTNLRDVGTETWIGYLDKLEDAATTAAAAHRDHELARVFELDKFEKMEFAAYVGADSPGLIATPWQNFRRQGVMNTRHSVQLAYISLIEHLIEHHPPGEPLQIFVSCRTTNGVFMPRDRDTNDPYSRLHLVWRAVLARLLRKHPRAHITYYFRLRPENEKHDNDEVLLTLALLHGSDNFEIFFHEVDSPQRQENEPPPSLNEFLLAEEYCAILALATKERDFVDSAFILEGTATKKLPLPLIKRAFMRLRDGNHQVLSPEVPGGESRLDLAIARDSLEFERRLLSIAEDAPKVAAPMSEKGGGKQPKASVVVASLFKRGIPDRTRPKEWFEHIDTPYMRLRRTTSEGKLSEDDWKEYCELERQRIETFDEMLDKFVVRDVVPKSVLDDLSGGINVAAKYASFMFHDSDLHPLSKAEIRKLKTERLKRWLALLDYDNYKFALVDEAKLDLTAKYLTTTFVVGNTGEFTQLQVATSRKSPSSVPGQIKRGYRRYVVKSAKLSEHFSKLFVDLWGNLTNDMQDKVKIENKLRGIIEVWQ